MDMGMNFFLKRFIVLFFIKPEKCRYMYKAHYVAQPYFT